MHLPLILVLLAQAEVPPGIVRGELIAVTSADFSVRMADQREVKCTYSTRTWFERDTQRIEPAAMKQGDRIEMVADRQNGCFARSVHVLDNTPVKQIPGRRPSLKREYSSPTEAFAPRGELTFAGIVTGLEADKLTIRTRAQGNHTFLIRHDTRFMSEGLRQTREQLASGTRVFVRAGRNLEGQVEVYSVIWGEILKP